MRRYKQYYEYDAVGNILQMRHTVSGGTGSWTRYYTIDTTSNRLLSTVVGSGTPENYTYDPRGNMTNGFGHLQSMTYNASNRLEKVVIDNNRTAYYQYDGAGQRVRKTILNNAVSHRDTRKYFGSWEIYTKFVSGVSTLERETLHISDDMGRVALIDTRTVGTGTEPAQLLRYQYSNHLSTATLELDATAAIISYEEYFPFGSTSFQSGRSGAEVALKRYRYTGKERDEESGLYYHGARYYIPWLARWTAIDPMEAKYAGMSPYNYSFNNPVMFNDPSGADPGWGKKGDTWEYKENLTVDNYSELGYNDYMTAGSLFSTTNKIADGEFSYSLKEDGTVFDKDENQMTSTFTIRGTSINISENFFTGLSDGYLAGWESTKQFVKSLGTEEGWLNIIRSNELLFSPAIDNNGNSYVQKERQELYNNIERVANNMDKYSAYQWGYGLGFGSEKLTEVFIFRKISNINSTKSLTTNEGFLFKGFTITTPFNIPVQRFGNMSIIKPDFWGMRIGTSQFANRTFGAIKPVWNPLTQHTKGIIPSGTQIKFGIIGPQGWKYPGGSFQFIVPSKNIINQSSKFIIR